MEKLSAYTWSKLNEFIYQENTTDNIDDLRSYFLKNIHQLIPFDRAFFDLAASENHSTEYFNPLSYTIEEIPLKEYYQKYIHGDYVSWMFSSTNESLIYRDSDIVSHEVRKSSPLYQEWLKPMGVYYSCGINFVYNKIPYGSVTLFSSKERGDYSLEHLSILSVLAPHIGLKFYQLFPYGINHSDLASSSFIQKKYHLTNREKEVLNFLCSELDIEEISKRLFISTHTVRKHTANIYKKTHCRNRAQLISLITPQHSTNTTSS